jgi:hypothetical protein
VPGQGEEGFFEGGPAQSERADVQVSVGQPAGDGGQDRRPIGYGEHDPARSFIDGRLPGG